MPPELPEFPPTSPRPGAPLRARPGHRPEPRPARSPGRGPSKPSGAGGRSQGDVNDSRAGHIRVFDIREGGTLTGDRIFVKGVGCRFDNIRFDRDGRLWAAAFDDGVHCYAPDATLLGRIRVPEPVSNLTFGGPKRNRLFITATTSLYSLVTSMTGAHRVSFQ